MKKGICLAAAAALSVMLLTACGNNSEQQSSENARNQAAAEDMGQLSEAEEQEPSDGTDAQTGKVLVVYYSASGNTKAVGDIIAQYTGGDTFEIIPVDEYTSEDLDWTKEGSRVNLEHEDESLQDIELVSTTVDNFDSYDTVFIGYPKFKKVNQLCLCSDNDKYTL